MFALLMGIDLFWKGISYNTQQFFAKNPSYLDWVSTFASVTNNPYLTQYWIPWLVQRSFPVIKVQRNGDKVTVSQSPCAPNMNSNITWPIPNLAVEEFDGNLLKLTTYTINLSGKFLT